MVVVHGNELCGAIAADWLLQQKVMPIAGRLSIGFMNVAAYLSYDPEHPNRSRWINKDANRFYSRLNPQMAIHFMEAFSASDESVPYTTEQIFEVGNAIT